MTTEAVVQERNVTLNGLRFSYREWEHPGAPPLLLLHGYTGHARSWDAFAASWQERFRVLALDQRGHGDTDYADDYAPERMVEDIDAFVTELGLAPVTVIGVSMGGRNAFAYAGDHPDAVSKLVIVDIGPDIPAVATDRIRAGVLQRDVFDDPEEAFLQAGAANPRPSDDVLRARTVGGLKQLPDGRWTYKYDPKLRAPDRPLPRPDPDEAWANVRRIACPVLLLRGAVSDVLAPETAELMTREIPDCQLVVIEDSAHTITLDQPDAFKAAVDAFI